MRNIKLVSERDSTVQYIRGLEDDCSATATAIVPHDLSDRVFVSFVVGRQPACSTPHPNARHPSRELDPASDTNAIDACRVVVASILPDGTMEWQTDVLGALDPDERPVVCPDALLALDMNSDALTVGLSTGHILSVVIETRQVTEVGCIDGGVAGMRYSPDGELIALVSGLGQMMVMTSGWEVLMEVCVVDVACDAPQGTAVAEADAEHLMRGELPGGDGRENEYMITCDGNDSEFGRERARKDRFQQRRGGRGLGASDVGVSWRGDGKYVATCVRCGEEDLCPGRVRIWDLENLSLHAIGEQSPGTLPVLAWQPNGRTLCVANCLSDDQVEEMAILRLTKQEVGGQGQAPEVRHVGAWKRELRRRQEAAQGDATGPSRVFIYERNGLQHGDFVVPGDGLRIEQMAWSGDSRTLAVVVCEEQEGPEEIRRTRSVQIWCRSNWKWYNKWTRTFGSGENVLIAWHEGPGGPTLSTWTTKPSTWVISSSKLAWDYDVSEYGTVAVVSGDRLMITPMRQCMIPPPLCAVELMCGRPIACALFSRTGDGREIVGALLDDGRLAVATCPNADDWESMLDNEDGGDGGSDGEKGVTVEHGNVGNRIVMPVIFEGLGNHQFRHAAFLGATHVVFVGQEANGVDFLFHYSFSMPDASAEGELHFETCVELEACVSRLVRSGESSVFFEFEDGRCRTYSVDEAAGQVGAVESAAGFGTRCDVVRVASLSYGHEETNTPGEHGGLGSDCIGDVLPTMCVLGLEQATGRLFRNDVLLASDATSMSIHARSSGGPHLLYTTRNNLLKTLPLFGEDKDAVTRAIEDGCVLVSLPEASVDVIMQAPRGNLEIVRPRSLVLPAVRCALDRLDFTAAWRLATVNRIDTNVLVDYGWPMILENVRAFIHGVGADTEVAGFLQSLELPSAGADFSDGSKPTRSQRVCEAFRNEVAGQRSWLRTELTSHTKCGDIGKALLRVKEIKEMDMNNNTDDDVEMTAQPCAEVGLKHVLLHNPENRVYEAALGEYELQLSYMVVAHIQRDPGEYLAQLQEFAVIDNQHIRMAAIDKHLGRFDRAVENLFEAGSFDDALELAASKGLLKHLLALVDSSASADPNTSSKRHVVLKALGEHLSKNGKYEDAALAYVAAGDLEQALRSYRLASAWRPAMTLAARLGKDDVYIKDLARRLCDDLEQFQPVEAARINLDYLANVPAAVRLFAQGGEWREALRLAVGKHRIYLTGPGDARGSDPLKEDQSDGTDALMEILVSVASASAARLLEGFVEDACRVEKYWSRLRDLRDKRVAMEVLENERDAVALDDDAFIDTASVATDMSMFSMLTDATATSTSTFASFASTLGGRRSGKRQPKKKNKIRRGSPEEEDQLVRHLLTLLPKANVCEECGQLAEFLVYIGHEDDATRLQASLKALIDTASAALDDVLAFPPPGRKMVLPYAVREGIFDDVGPATLLRVDHHVASVAEAELQVQVQEGKTAMSHNGWKWEMLRKN